jgi:small Trp-rich protein
MSRSDVSARQNPAKLSPTLRYSAALEGRMPLVIVGVLLLVAKVAELGPFGSLSWWLVLAPFAAAVLWWHFADSTGLTRRRAMDKMERRKVERREKALDALGLSGRREKQATRAREEAARRASADPTQQGDPPGLQPPPLREPPTRREPRL